MKNRFALAAALFSLSVIGVYASGDHAAKSAPDVKPGVSATAAAIDSKALPVATKLPMTDGEIKKVDKEGGKITIKHGEIKNLDMPGMTMVFRVKEPAMLDQVRAGDKVNFSADKINGNITVTKIEASK